MLDKGWFESGMYLLDRMQLINDRLRNIEGLTRPASKSLQPHVTSPVQG